MNKIADNHDDIESLTGATWNGNWVTVKRLLSAGADVNQTNSQGYTALDLAYARGDKAIVSLLLSHGATDDSEPPQVKESLISTESTAQASNNLTVGDDKKGFFGKLANGDFGLATTYWKYGVLFGLCFNFFLEKILIQSRAPISHGVIVFFVLLYIAYLIPVLMGIWRAARNYQGQKIWAALARVAVVLNLILLVFSFLVVLK